MADSLDFKIESAFIFFIESYWQKNGVFPRDTEINQNLGLTKEQIAELLSRKGVQASLDRRGVVSSQQDGFTAIQLAAINTYIDISDTRPDRTKLSDLGLTPSQWNGWMRDAKFRKYVMDRAAHLFNNDTLAAAQMAVSKKVKAGDPRILKLYFDIRAKDTELQNNQDMRSVMMGLIEIIQKHVPDQAVLKSIASEFESLVSGKPAVIPGELTATPPNILEKMADATLIRGKGLEI